MIEELFHIGPISVSPFGVMMVLAFLTAWAQVRWGIKYLGIGDDEDASAILLASGIGGIGGAKLYYAILYQDPASLIDRSGLVWYGGLIGGTILVLLTARSRKMPLISVVDAGAPAVALGYAVGRIGCFLVGDDYGVPTDLPWGVSFPYGLPGPTTAGFMRREYGAAVAPDIPADELLRVHPTQLYETFACLLIWAFGAWLIKRGTRPGMVSVAVFSLMATERFLVEFVRAKDDRIFGQFTIAQLISVGVVVLLFLLWLRLRRSPPEPPPAQAAARQKS